MPTLRVEPGAEEPAPAGQLRRLPTVQYQTCLADRSVGLVVLLQLGERARRMRCMETPGLLPFAFDKWGGRCAVAGMGSG